MTQHAPWIEEISEILTRLGVEPDRGLSAEQARQKLHETGPNQLQQASPKPLWRKLLAQFGELVIWILLVAAVISGLMGEWIDTLAILAIVLLNGVIGFVQEERAEQALAALKKLSAPVAKVLRDGLLRSLPAVELVPGDVIEIEAGDNVPADARLLEAFRLAVQEAALTGESTPVEKDAALRLTETAPLGDRRNMAYMGTIAAAGKARAVVVATGMGTELGRIAGLLGGAEREPTPLQRRLAELGRVLVVVCLVVVAVILALQLARGGNPYEAFLTAVSLAVASVPEGLPAVVTIALALGLQRMVKRNALVRKLPSVETLGSVTVICSDKTGTLTRNEMTVQEIVVGDDRYRVTGIGYEPRGEYVREPSGPRAETEESGGQATGGHALERDASGQILAVEATSDLLALLEIGAWCNNSKLVPRGDGDPSWEIIGDPTEGALMVAARKAGIDPTSQRRTLAWEIPFDSTRKAMSVVVREADGSHSLFHKGAPEVVLASCRDERRGGRISPLTDERRQTILAASAQMAHRALRVLALADRRSLPSAEMPGEPSPELEQDFVFAGLVGMIDPPREDAKPAIEKCRAAGIQPVMITGDHPETARAVASRLGLLAGGESVLTGTELDRLSDEELARIVPRVAVFARTAAEHKLRIVKAWKSLGHVVAMTGDGVNDAPAIRAADIGIAMGITGTDVTKEASDMVLMDDNFASIVSAVEEGRGIFANIQKVLQFLLSANLGEVLLMFVASLLGWPTPLLAIHLLWINLVTDGLPALGLSVEPPEPGIMERRPRPPQSSILSWQMGSVILVQGLLDATVALIAFGWIYLRDPSDEDHARSVTFCVVVYTELFRSLAARSPRLTLWQLGLHTNPLLVLAIVVSGLLQLAIVAMPFAQPIFRLPAHTIYEWELVLVLALVPVTVVEVGKLIRNRFA